MSSLLEEQYYIDLKKNILRLHQLSLGTFVAHAATKKELEEVWNVTGGDSVILYSVPLGDPLKDGYWILNYEFMTSLPNDPIYTSIKQYKQVDRDSFRVLYYRSPIELTLKSILKDGYLEKAIDLNKLKSRDKKVYYLRQSSAHFRGKSVVYEDKDCNCLRQNVYDITPKAYAVSSDFFDLKTKKKLDKSNRPNLMLRRLISKKELDKLAEKEYTVK